ncbi:MAG: pre-peptidase C-terminal domain-containing protein, partial [Planctomycetota bacterium]|nr:pre-peptidase C-terminal domain-containing protein [Planctomycetota bacterium]
GGDGPLSRHDYYSIRAQAGDVLTVSTTTPADGAGQFINTLDPALQIVDAAGAVLAANADGAADGRNALLTWTAPAAGTYYIRVYGAAGSGEYVLNVQGATGTTSAPFTVATTNPADGAHLAAPPAYVTVDFTNPVLLSSVQAGDLTVDGLPALGLSVIDADTIRFALPSGLPSGEHRLAIAAGAITDVFAAPVAAFSSGYLYDTLAPRVAASTVQENQVVPVGAWNAVITFNEPLLASPLDATDFLLSSALHGEFLPASWNYDAASCQLRLSYVNLPEDAYTLTLRSGDGRFEDLVGCNLDGEPLTWPVGPGVSGDGIAGGDFVVHFRTDISISPLGTLTPVAPAGSLVYSAQVTGDLYATSDTDAFSIPLAAGQRISLVVQGDRQLQAVVRLISPANALLASAAAPAPGLDAVIHNALVSSAGVYLVVVSAAAGSAGTYSLQAILNSDVEAENLDSSNNNSLAAAQDLDASSMPLAGGADRLAVTGNIGVVTTANFETGRLGPDWTGYSSNVDGVLLVSTERGYANGKGGLYMWTRYPGDNTYAREDAIWRPNLTGLTDPVLGFW